MSGSVAVVLAVCGILPWTADTAAVVRGLAAVVLLGAITTALVAWGLLRSISVDRHRLAEADFDSVLIEAAGSAGACGCGHTHDPDELHITDACEHDGAGVACEHNCESCVLTALRSTGRS
jgi:hypothetical protein